MLPRHVVASLMTDTLEWSIRIKRTVKNIPGIRHTSMEETHASRGILRLPPNMHTAHCHTSPSDDTRQSSKFKFFIAIRLTRKPLVVNAIQYKHWKEAEIGAHMTLRIPAAISCSRLWWEFIHRFDAYRVWANIYELLCEVKTISEILYVRVIWGMFWGARRGRLSTRQPYSFELRGGLIIQIRDVFDEPQWSIRS